LEQRPGCGYQQKQMANSCCPLSCQGPEDLSAKCKYLAHSAVVDESYSLRSGMGPVFTRKPEGIDMRKTWIGVRRKVPASAELPRNWADFLHCADNKTELFHFLSTRVVSGCAAVDKQLFVTDGKHVFHTCAEVSHQLDPCSYKEADTRIILHVAHAAHTRCNNVMIRTVDTDVVVLAVSSFQRLPVTEMWVVFGTGNHFRYLPIHPPAC